MNGRGVALYEDGELADVPEQKLPWARELCSCAHTPAHGGHFFILCTLPPPGFPHDKQVGSLVNYYN